MDSEGNPTPMSAADNEFSEKLHHFLHSGLDCNFTVICSKNHWTLSRIILARGSEYFSRACFGPFAESSRREIELMEDDPAMIHALLYFFYYHDYPYPQNTGPTKDAEDTTPLAWHARIYATADKYGALRLKKAAKKIFTRKATNPKTKYNAKGLRNLLELVYTSTPPTDLGLRKPTMNLLKRHRGPLRSSKELRAFIRSGLGGGDLALDAVGTMNSLGRMHRSL